MSNPRTTTRNLSDDRFGALVEEALYLRPEPAPERHPEPAVPHWFVRTMLGAVAFTLVAVVLAACARSAPDPKACEQQLTDAGQATVQHRADPIDHWPAPCRGLSEQQRETALGNAILRMWGGDPTGVDAPITVDVP